MWSVVEWFRRLGKPEGWCGRCRCVHEHIDWKKFEDELIQKMADQIRDEIDRELMEELLAMSQTPEPGGQAPEKKDET